MDIDVSEIIRKNRVGRGISTRELAKMAGVSASMISTIEAGKSSPTLNILAKVTGALNMDLSEVIETVQGPQVYQKKNVKECKAKKSKDKSFACFLLSDGSPNRRVELYTFEFNSKGYHESPGHRPGTIEYLVVESGEMVVEVKGQQLNLKAGDAIEFRAGCKHKYIQETNKLARGTVFHYFS